jgi:glycosyltransferase involved in cell wall biosynthesis
MMSARSADGFIWFVAQDWWYHNRAHSDFQLMKEVARERPVLVVNSLGLRLPRPGKSTNPLRRIGRKLSSMSKLLRKPLPELPGFHVLTPVFLPFYGDGRLARLNARWIRAQVTFAARLAGLPEQPAIGVTIPTAWPVVEKMRRSALVFNRSDLHSAFPEADGEWVESLERALLANSDRVLYVSHELMRNDATLVGDRAFFLDHGVDLVRFSPDKPVDPEIAAIPGPRVGFFGGLDDYVVDFDLLLRTAREVPEASLVLIGDATCSMEELTALPNVHWLGHRPYESIPSLGRVFDVAIMPWLDNEWIRFANPIKLKEYLALGLPVVSTEYPEVDAYRGLIRIAHDRDSFPALVREALADPGDPKARHAFVLPYSWQGRAAALLDLVDEVGGH